MAYDDFYSQRLLNGGVFNGTTLIQAHGSVGGTRYVFVKLHGQGFDGMVYPTVGGILTNPFKGNAKIYAGDLVEYNPGITDDSGATLKILKSYEAAKATSQATDTDIYLVRDGFHHIPFVGDFLMIGQKDFATKGTAATVTAVSKETDPKAGDVWKVTLSAAIGALKQGDVLVEASAGTGSVLPMVTNPNAYAPSDYDFIYNPAASDDDFEGARYMFTPCLVSPTTYLYIDRMSPVCPALKALNKSLVPGWFVMY